MLLPGLLHNRSADYSSGQIYQSIRPLSPNRALGPVLWAPIVAFAGGAASSNPIASWRNNALKDGQYRILNAIHCGALAPQHARATEPQITS
jgi:hypothetical protein